VDETGVKQLYNSVFLLMGFKDLVLFLFFMEQKMVIQDAGQKKKSIIKM
jgi:hypothetical protein